MAISEKNRLPSRDRGDEKGQPQLVALDPSPDRVERLAQANEPQRAQYGEADDQRLADDAERRQQNGEVVSQRTFNV